MAMKHPCPSSPHLSQMNQARLQIFQENIFRPNLLFQKRQLLNSKLNKMIEQSFWEERKLQNSKENRSRGRPENNKDLDKDTLEKVIFDYFCGVELKNSENQRIDARTTTIIRKLRKIPDCILKYVSSKYKYKNKNIGLVAESYCKAFVLGFLPYFGLHPDVSKFDLFLDFIVLSFPKSKVKTILKELLETKSLSKERFDNLESQFKIRKLSSKSKFHELYLCNSTFDLIITKIYKNLSRMNLSKEDIIEEILRKIIAVK